MRASPQKAFILWLLMVAGCAFGMEVEVTVFTMKDGRRIEVLSFASATTEDGGSIHSVTTTAGKRIVLSGEDVTSRSSVKKELAELPDYARERLESQKRMQQDWRARADAERKAEELKRRTAFVRAAELAEEGKVVRVAELQERTLRQRCAQLWEAHRRAMAQIKASQEAIVRGQENLHAAVDDLHRYERWPARTPEELDQKRAMLYRAERRIQLVRERIRDAERSLLLATQQANDYAAQLAKAKAEWAQAEYRVAEARQKYEAARERFKQPVKESDPSGEEIQPRK